MLKVLPHNQILLWNLSLVLFDVAFLQGKDKSSVLKSQIISFFTDTKEHCVSHKPKISTSSEHTDQAALLGLFGCFVTEDEGNAWTIRGCSSLKWYITQGWHKLGQEVKHQSPHINHMKSKTRQGVWWGQSIWFRQMPIMPCKKYLHDENRVRALLKYLPRTKLMSNT